MATTLLTAWIICGLVNYGFTVAHYQRTYPSPDHARLTDDRMFSATFIPLGPIALAGTFLYNQHHQGWML